MDHRITGVLAEFHDRMRTESDRRQKGQGKEDPSLMDQFLLPVGPETGQLLYTLIRSLDAPQILEIGTSYGYSTIWMGAAAKASDGHLTTMELKDYKSAHAHDMAKKAGIDAHITFQVGDAVTLIGKLTTKIDFVLLDLWKDLYTPCFEAFYPKLNPGAIIVADNMIHPGGPDIERYARAVRAKSDIETVLLPVGSGIEVSRLIGRGAA